MRRSCYRQFHDHSAMATVAMVTLSEFELHEFDPARRGEELVLHGLIQMGAYQAHRGSCVANGWRYMTRLGLAVAPRHDPKRSAAILERIRIFEPEAEYHLPADLGATAAPFLNPRNDLGADARLILIQARMWNARLAVHPLLLRLEGETIFAMDPATGLDHEIAPEELSRHIASPVHAGGRQFAGGIYLDTGLALRVTR